MIALRREETGVLAMELSENFWPEDLELAVLAVHDIARSPQNSLLLLVVLDSDFDTPLWDFLSQILQPGILAQNAVVSPNSNCFSALRDSVSTRPLGKDDSGLKFPAVIFEV